MATTNTNDLRIKNAKNLISSFNGTTGEALAYLFVGRVQPWPDENLPPMPQNNYQTFNTTYDNMFAMKRIATTDSYHMIPKLNWSSGTTYDYYRQDYSTINKSFSGANNLYDCLWIVRNQTNNVYICLNNNGNIPSTVEPLNTSNEPFVTADGYQWQRIYNMTYGDYLSYTTDNFMPITQTDVVVSVDGAISTVIIDNEGGGFTVNPIGAPNAIPFYYCNIEGDGTGAVAKVTVAGEVVTDIEVVRSGSGYTYGTLDFVTDRCYKSLPDLDLEKDKLNPAGDGTLRTTVVVPPPGGWGTDIVRELGGTRVGVFSDLNYNLFNNFESSFRQVGILQDATFTTVNPTVVEACYAVQVTGLAEGTTYSMGETITQISVVNGISRLAKGLVVGYDKTSGVIRYTQSSVNVDIDGNLYRFSGTNTINGLTSGMTGTPTMNSLTVSDVKLIAGYASPEVTDYSGIMTYLSNISPVVRDPLQTERISLLISF
tara:strand:- start:616 stop:2070 length:1455 start_codon:yes stop_codon:yes gene_type:complete